MIFGKNTTRNISKSFQISLPNAREIRYNNFEILLVVFMPNSTTHQAIPYTNTNEAILKFPWVAFKDLDATEPLI